MRAWTAGAAVLVLALAACGGDSGDVVTGVVVELDGGITSVDRFVLRFADGTEQELEPAPGIIFHDGAPIGHLGDHLRSGVPVRVDYEVLDDGTWVALSVEDAGG
jgi:hypothetical protein